MTKEQKLDLLLSRQITHTAFATVSIPAQSIPQGIRLGTGRCVAVILRLKQFVLYTQTGTSLAVGFAQYYYGDANQQSFEGFRGANSEIIFCRDLSEVYIKGNGLAIDIEVMIYQAEPTDLEFYSA